MKSGPVFPAPAPSEAPRELRKLAAIMFTDMVGYSALTQRDEALTLELLEEHRLLLRSLFARQGGREVKTIGDGFLVEFDSALDAVACAVETQQTLVRRNAAVPPERRILIRVGIHLGDVVYRQGDVFGDGVNIAARIEPLAEPGGICVSEDVYRQIRNKLQVPVTKLGRGGLKNIGLPMEVYRVGLPGQRAGASLAARLRFLGRKRRLGLLALGGLAVASLALNGAMLVRALRGAEDAADDRLTVAVADFANETKEEDLDGLSGMLITSLEQSRRLSVMTRSRMLDVVRQMGREEQGARIDEVLGREICRKARVDALVVATVRRFGALYSVDLKVLDAGRNAYLFTVRAEARGKEDIPRVLDKLSDDTRAALKENQAEIVRASNKVAERTTTNFEAYQHYFLGEQLLGKSSANDDLATMVRAIREYERAAELDPSFPLAHYRIALVRSWSFEGDPKEPLAAAMRELERAPPKERLYIRALDAQLGGQREQATALYQQILAEYPNEKEAAYLMGDLAFHANLYRECLASFERALEIDPLYAIAYDHLVDAFLRLRERGLARWWAEQAAEKLPGDRSAQWLLSALVAQGRLEEADAFARRALERRPDSVLLPVWQASAPMWRGDFAAAEARLAALGRDAKEPLRAAALRALARVLVFRGKYREADALLDRVASELKGRDDLDAVARGVVVQGLMAAWGRRDAERLRAIDRRRRELGVESDPTAWQLAYAWLLLGEPGRWRDAVRLYPSEAEFTRRYLGALELRDAGRGAEAEQALRSLHEENGFSGLALMELASLALSRGEPAVALEAAEALRSNRMEPAEEQESSLRAFYYPRSLYLLGRAYEARGDAARAAEHYGALLELWRDADEDLALLQEVRGRLSGLGRSAARGASSP